MMIMPGVQYDTLWVAFWISIVLGFVQFGAKVLSVMLFPITGVLLVFTFGLFAFVINAGCILLTDRWIDGFQVDGFWSAFWLGLVYTILSSLLLPKRS